MQSQSGPQEPITSIFIPETRDISAPTRHTTYIISVGGPVRSFTLSKRYSDFNKLHQELVDLDSRGTPEELPKKSFNFMGIGETSEFIEERRKALEHYLQTILYHKDPIWRKSKAWKVFFNINFEVNELLNQIPGSATSFRWMQEYESLYSYSIQIRSVLNQRDRFASQGDSTQAHSKKFQARKALKDAQDSLSQLEKNVELDGVAVRELERRKALLQTIRADFEELEEMTRTLTKGNNSNSTNRAILFGAPPNAETTSSSRRKFGNPSETEKTRMLDNENLLQLQEQEMKIQDQMVEKIGKVIERQKEISLVMSRELDEQNAVLEQTEEKVANVEANLKIADKKAKRFLLG